MRKVFVSLVAVVCLVAPWTGQAEFKPTDDVTAFQTLFAVKGPFRGPNNAIRGIPGAARPRGSVGGHEGYITVGLYDDGTPGELFIRMAKEGSTISGLMDSFATAVSMTLQYGVPLQVLVDKFQHVRFEPSGWTGNSEIPYAKSVMDYLFRWLGAKFISADYRQSEAGETPNLRPTEAEPQKELPFHAGAMDAPICSECGSMMTSNGSCYKCENCGATSGCS